MTESGRILIVDDETPVREVLSDYFTDRGYAVITAANGHEGLAAFARERPDIVLLDMRMPGIGGLEVLKRLREADPDVAVIMVTANEDLATARETLSIGAFDYVAKPFDFEHLNRAVGTAIIHSARAPGVDVEPVPSPADLWTRLVSDVFRVVRGMGADARASTGVRLEDAALSAARRAMDGRAADVASHLTEIKLLAAVASRLGDVSPAERSEIETALTAAEAALRGR
jgi:two-component system response regulator (stage 0 sporulation protein F)